MVGHDDGGDYHEGEGTFGAGSADLLTNQVSSVGLEAKWLWYRKPTRRLRLSFTSGLPDDAADLTLRMGDVAVALPDNAAARCA